MSVRTILLADDEPHTIQVLSVVLRNAGYRVIAAEDGDDALEVATTERIHLVVADAGRARLVGPDLARRLWSDPRTAGLPLIYLTAQVDSERDRWFERTPNVRAILSKPFSPRALVAEVSRWITSDRDSAAEAA